jgi:apolipoprotein N-acyltransferase
MTPRPEISEQDVPIRGTVSAGAARLSFRPLSVREQILWSVGAAVSFHVGYEFCPPIIFVFLLCVYQLAHVRTRPHAMYAGWMLGLLIYGPQLSFFWNIFGSAAIALWLVLATWLSVFLVLQRFALLKLGPRFAAVTAPFLWTGLEYFRSELYYLKFSWVNIGYSFSPWPRQALAHWLGMYGIGFALMCFAAQWPFRRSVSQQRKWTWTFAFGILILGGLMPHMPGAVRSTPAKLKVAGVQLEFPDDDKVLTELDTLLAKSPQTELFVLSEYTFPGPIPSRIKSWCRKNRKYLIAGGKDFVDASETQFRNTAFVIGPDGEQVFSQVKGVPIQFFKDGLPALEEKIWESPWGSLGLCVCYDLSYTRITDELVRKGAQAIIAPTMDVEEWGERQHRLHARVAPIRAAEYGLPIFRLCSSGISQAIDGKGTVLATAPFPGQGQSLEATLELSRGKLPLDRWLAWPCLGVCAALATGHVVYSFRPRRGG